MGFFDAYRFSILGSKGVQDKWCDLQVHGVLDEQVNVISAVLPLKSEWMSVSGVDKNLRANRTRYVSKILLFRYTTISSNFIASNFASFFWSITKLKPNKASIPVARILSNIRKTISCGKLEHEIRECYTDQGGIVPVAE